MTQLDKKVYQALEAIPDCYSYFLEGVFSDVQGNEAFERQLLAFLDEHPDARTSDILEFELDNDWIQNDPDVEFEDD